jgi:ribosome recycling factor
MKREKKEKNDATILHFSFLSATTIRCATPKPTEFSRKNQNKQTNKQPAENKTNEDARTLKHEDKARNPTLPSGLAFFLAGHKMRNAKLKSVKNLSPFLRCSIALIRKKINKKISRYFLYGSIR